jgi:ABC-type sulfate transport system substrate-binding protein
MTAEANLRKQEIDTKYELDAGKARFSLIAQLVKHHEQFKADSNKADGFLAQLFAEDERISVTETNLLDL